MSVISAETVIKIKSMLNYCMFEDDNVESIKNILHQISWALNREVMFKFEDRELHEAEQIAEIDKAIAKLTEMRLNLLSPNLSTSTNENNNSVEKNRKADSLKIQ